MHCLENKNRWIPQPEKFGGAYTKGSTCGNSDGAMVLHSLTPGKQYGVSFRLNGSSSITTWGNATANAQGLLTISALAAGSYTDITLRDSYNQDFGGLSANIKDLGAPGIGIKALNHATSCTANDGSLILKNSAGGNGVVRLLFEQDGVPQDLNLPMANGLITLSNLPPSYLSHIRLVTSSGCVSNSINTSIRQSSGPVITASRVIPFSAGQTRSNIEIGGLTSGNTYQAWIRKESDGPYLAFDVLESSSGVFTVDGSASTATGIGGDFYFEMYVTDASGCQRSNAITFRPGDDLSPDGIGGRAGSGRAGRGTAWVILYEMYHRYLYKAGGAGTPNPGHPYSGPETYGEYVNTIVNILIHEFGHVGSLNHTFRGGISAPCSDVYWTQLSCNQNNFMDNNCGPDKNSFAPCQIDQMHSYLERTGWGRYYLCDNSRINSSISYFPYPSTGNMVFLNFFSGPSAGVEEFFSITPQNGSGDTYYAHTPILFLNLMRFSGQTIEVCANTLNADNCLGNESCATVTFPTFGECRLT